MQTITIRDSTTTGKGVTAQFEIEVPLPCTLGELIRFRVREEVARYNSSHSPVYRGLGCPDDATPTAAGFEFERVWRRIDWEKQADVALRAFNKNGFFVFVGQEQFDDLDAVVDLPLDVELRFVRLVPLIGG
jgi:hypothetical protein